MMKRITKDMWKRCMVAVRSYVQSRNGGTFCLFVLFATVLWFGHALNSMRDQKLQIPIVYTGLNPEVMFEEELPQAFTIYVRDQGKRLRLYKNDKFTPIQIDLQGLATSESGVLQLTTEMVKQKITDQLQGTTRLQRVLPENISVHYYKQHQKTVAVRLQGDVELAPQYQFTQLPTLQPDSMTIYGSEEALQAIEEVATETLALSQVKDTLRMQVDLQPIRGIRFAESTVTVYACAEQFTEKVFTLPICVVGVPEGETLRLFPPTVEATVRVGVSHFNDITAADLQVECVYPTEQLTQLPLQLRYTSPYITQSRITPTEVEYIIEK